MTSMLLNRFLIICKFIREFLKLNYLFKCILFPRTTISLLKMLPLRVNSLLNIIQLNKLIILY